MPCAERDSRRWMCEIIRTKNRAAQYAKIAETLEKPNEIIFCPASLVVIISIENSKMATTVKGIIWEINGLMKFLTIPILK